MAKLIRRDSSKQSLITSFFNSPGNDRESRYSRSGRESIDSIPLSDASEPPLSENIQGGLQEDAIGTIPDISFDEVVDDPVPIVVEEKMCIAEPSVTDADGVVSKPEDTEPCFEPELVIEEPKADPTEPDVIKIDDSPTEQIQQQLDEVKAENAEEAPKPVEDAPETTESPSLDAAAVVPLGGTKRKIIDDDYEGDVIDTVEVLSTNQEAIDFEVIDTKVPDILWDTSGNDTTTTSCEEGTLTAFNVYDLDKYVYTGAFTAPQIPPPTGVTQISADLLGDEDDTDYIKESEERAFYLSCKAAKICKMFNEYIENYYLYHKIFSFPPWIQPCYIRDALGNRPDSEDYNPSTLQMPPPNHKWIVEYRSHHYTPTMKQYWCVKSVHFDKIVFFKMGRFYELFYIDACIGNKACDLRWMGKENKPHVGFPEQSLQFYASKLVNLGYKVVVVEQMETPKEMLQKTRGMRNCDKVISREICQVYSKGTLAHSGMLPSEAQPLAAIMFRADRPRTMGDQEYCNFAICIVDVVTNSISLSYHEDDERRQTLKTILTRTRPAEILYSPDNVSKMVIELFKRLPFKPQISVCMLNLDEYDVVNKIVQENINKDVNSEFNPANLDKPLLVKATILASNYLSNMELGNLIKSSNIYYCSQYKTKNLKMSSWVYEHLEVFDTILGDKVNSFQHYLDNTTTPFGSRLLRRWITYPSVDLLIINSRLDSVEWLLDNHQVNNELRSLLRSISDLERILGSVCNSSKAKRAIYFHSLNTNRLSSFHKLLIGFDPFESVRALLAESSCKHLSILTALEGQGGAFPDLKPIVSLFLDKLYLDDKQCFPNRGQDAKYDAVADRINSIIDKLNAHLVTLSTFIKTELKFTHTKFRYEVECPDNLFKKFTCKCEITSTRKGFIRFRTKEIVNLCNELEDAEYDRSEVLFDYFKVIIGEFMAFVPQFYKAIQIVAEIDCLSTFAFNALSCGYTMSRPKLLPMGGKPILHLENSIHPILGMMDTNFVSNDICMNCHEEPNVCLLLTGPNMGGKSTILRQICLTAIMAQIGSFVPAKVCEMSIVDKIFTRLGASDAIMEGKSTFYVELEEISQMMYQASPFSLAMIDELGRGTSTFDGTAIALSSLVYIANRIGCRCIFSTHYHLICDEAKLVGNISLYNMSALIADEEVKFLFKFVKGECSKSQGLYIAKLANIPMSVISLAEHVGKIMENKINQKNERNELLKKCVRLYKAKNLKELEDIYYDNRI